MIKSNRDFKNILKDKYTYLGLALILYLGNAIVKSILFRISKAFPVFDPVLLSSIIPLLFLIIFFIMGDKEDFKRLKFFGIIMGLILLTFLITYMLNPQYYYWYFINPRGLKLVLRPDSGIYIILFMSLFKKDEEDKLIKYFTLGVWILFLYNFLLFLAANVRGYWTIIDSKGGPKESGYNLQFGYSMAFIFLYFFMRYRNLDKGKLKLLYLLTSIFSLITIFTDGSRGAFLPILVFFFFYFIRKYRSKIFYKKDNKWRINKKFLKIFLTIIFTFIIFVIIMNVLIYFEIIDVTNMNRNLRMIITGNFFSSNGRDGLYEMSIDAIKKRPLTGYGALGDRPIISQRMVYGYPHNVVIELILNLGIILGLIIFFFYLYMSYRMVLNERNKKIKTLYIVCFLASFELLLSSSFWLIFYPWACIALYFRFSNVAIEDRKRIESLLHFQKRNISIVSSLLLATLLLYSGRNLYYYNKEYRSKSMEIDKPKVILTFESLERKDYPFYNRLIDENIPATIYIKSNHNFETSKNYGYMSFYQIDELNNSIMDLQSGLVEYEKLTKLSDEEIIERIDISNEFFKKHNIKEPISLGYGSGYINIEEQKVLSEYYPIIRRKEVIIPLEDFIYTSINKEDLEYLNSYFVNYVDMFNYYDSNLIDVIDLTKESDGLIVLRFISPSRNVYTNRMHKYYMKVIDYLKDSGFEFMTIEDLYEEARENGI